MNYNHSLGEKLKKEVGIHVSDDLTLDDFPATGRGVQALRPLKKGQIIFKEKDKLITPQYILKNNREIQCFIIGMEDDLNLDCFDLLTLWILIEDFKTKSEFKEYIKSLPIRFSVPYCQPMELQRNLPSQVRKQVDEELNNLEDRYDNLISLYKKSTYAYKLEAISKLSWAKFRWAAACVKSRSLFAFDHEFNINAPKWLTMGTSQDSSALCPWFDMLNHADINDVNSKFGYTSHDGLIVTCTRDISAGEQVFICYDNRPDDQLFIDYGFVFAIGENQQSYLLISLDMMGEVAMENFNIPQYIVKEKRVEFMQGIALLNKNYSLSVVVDNREKIVCIF